MGTRLSKFRDWLLEPVIIEVEIVKNCDRPNCNDHTRAYGTRVPERAGR